MYAARRAALLERLGPDAAIFFAHPVHVRNNDVEHDYRQDSDLQYLTGFEEPRSALVLTGSHGEHRAVMFVARKNPEREVWDGARLGVDAAPEALGVDAAFPIDELPQRLPGYLAGAPRLHFALGRDPAADAAVLEALGKARAKHRLGVEAPTAIVDPIEGLHEMRLVKEPEELARMRRAAEITAEAHLAAMRTAAPGRWEYEVAAEIERAFRVGGAARAAYGSIVGSGPNATVLHYRRNDRQMQEGDLLLVDAGCEYRFYAADVTRTTPVSGRFSPEQRAVYDVVLAAQEAAIAAVRPGVDLEAVHEAGLAVILRGLVDLGVLSGDVATLREEEAHKPYFMHRTSHWLGMDVHDVGRYFVGGRPRPLAAGHVLTVEPGLYFGPDAPERFRGIGVRIEDDVLVTGTGREVLTAAIPKRPEDVEAAAAG